jgi:hypothetical protein
VCPRGSICPVGATKPIACSDGETTENERSTSTAECKPAPTATTVVPYSPTITPTPPTENFANQLTINFYLGSSMFILAFLVSITTCALCLRNRILASIRKRDRAEILRMMQPPATVKPQTMERQRPVNPQGTFGARANHAGNTLGRDLRVNTNGNYAAGTMGGTSYGANSSGSVPGSPYGNFASGSMIGTSYGNPSGSPGSPFGNYASGTMNGGGSGPYGNMSGGSSSYGNYASSTMNGGNTYGNVSSGSSPYGNYASSTMNGGNTYGNVSGGSSPYGNNPYGAYGSP